MKKFTALLIVFSTLVHAALKVDSFKSKFVQQITDDQNKTIRYEGELIFKAPNLTLWRYVKPIRKSVVIDGSKMILVEPELEQVTISDFDKKQNLITLLKRAKKIGKNRYLVTVEKRDFYIVTDDKGIIRSIRYKDDLANDVKIDFLDPKQNVEVDGSVFEIKIPANYDRIYR